MFFFNFIVIEFFLTTSGILIEIISIPENNSLLANLSYMKSSTLFKFLRLSRNFN